MILLTISISGDVEKDDFSPYSLKILAMCLVKSLPARSFLITAWGKEYPSYTGTVWVTPSPESTTQPVVLPDE